MSYRKNIFTHKSLYDHQGTNDFFVNAVKANVNFHRRRCKEYRKILRARKYKAKDIRKTSDLYRLPPVCS